MEHSKRKKPAITAGFYVTYQDTKGLLLYL